MNRTASAWLVLTCLSLVGASSGCSDIAATNPYDPSAPAELRVKGHLEGKVLRATFGDRRLAAAGATVALLDGEEVLQQTTTDADGAYALAEVPLGTHALGVTLDRHETRRTTATVLDREQFVVDEVVLAPERGRLSVHARFPTGRTPSAALLLEGDPGDALLAELGRLALTLGPDGTLEVEGLPAGPYTARITAPGHRSSEPVAVSIERDATATFDATLAPWHHELLAAEATNAASLMATVTHDPELDRARLWVAAPSEPVVAPDDLEFAPSDGTSAVEVLLPDEGELEIRAQVANAAALDADASNDIEAYISPIFRAAVVVDRTPPRVLTARHVPEAGAHAGFAPSPEAILEVEAVDDGPQSRLVSVEVGPAGAANTPRPFAPRFTHTLGAPGLNPIEIVVVDAAGNRSAGARLESGAGIILDTTPPAPAHPGEPAIAPPASSRFPDAVALLSLSVADPEGSPLFLQIHDASLLPPPFEALPTPLPASLTVPVTLSPGDDGPRRIVGRVRDAAGNDLALPELTLIIDRRSRPVTAIRLRTPGGEVLNDGAGAINTSVVDLEIEVDGAEEPADVSVPELDAHCRIEPPAQSCHVRDVSLLAAVGAVTILQLTGLAVDDAGNAGVPYVRTVVVDLEAPGTASISFPEAIRQADLPEITNAPDLQVVADAVGAVRADLFLGECEAPPAGQIESVASLPGIARLRLPADGRHTVSARFSDAAANDVCVSRPVILDTGAPVPALAGEPALLPPAVDRFTGTSAFVDLAVTDPEGSQLFVRLRDTTLPPGDFVPLPAVRPDRITFPVTLSPGPDGPRTIAGVVRDVAGNELVLPELTLTIDTQARPVTAIRLLGPDGLPLNEGAGVISTATVDIELEVEGADEPAELRLPDLGVSCRIAPPATRCVIPDVNLDAREGSETILPLVAVAVDDAGNSDVPYLRTIVVDLEAPGPGRIAFLDVQRQADAVDVTNDPDLQVEADANGAVSARVFAGGCAAPRPPFVPLGAVPGVALLRLEDEDVTVVGADFEDAAGNRTCVERAIRLDQTPPLIEVRLGVYNAHGALQPLQPGQTRVATRTLGVYLELADPNEPDCPSPETCLLLQRVSLSPTFEGRAYEAFRPVVQLELPPVNQRHVVYAQLLDPAGNVSEIAAEAVDLRAVELDQQGPAVPGIRRHFIAPHKIRLELVAPGDRDVAYYQVERLLPELAADQGGGWQTIALTPAIADDDATTPTRVAAGCLLQQVRCTDAVTCVTAGPKTLLLEDRSVRPGFRHLYRVRAFDDLGNVSGDSIPVDAGVPALPPSFLLSLEGDERRLTIERGLGASTVDRISYDALGADGEPSMEAEFAAGSGTITLPQPPISPAPASGQPHASRPIEHVEVETSNPDRSIVWESTIDTLGMTTWIVEPSRPYKTGLDALAGSDGRIHVVHLEKNHDPGGTVIQYDILDDRMNRVARHELLLVEDDSTLEPPGMSTYPRLAIAENPENRHVYGAFRLDSQNAVRLVDLTASADSRNGLVEVPGPPAACWDGRGDCLRRTHLDFAFDARGLAHVAVTEPAQGGCPLCETTALFHTAFRPGAVPRAMTEIERGMDSQGMRLVMTDSGPVFVYLRRPSRQLILKYVGRPEIGLPLQDVPGLPADDWVFVQNTISATATGDRIDVAAVLDRLLYRATYAPGEPATIQFIAEGVRAPSITRSPGDVLQIVASVERPGRDELVVFRPREPGHQLLHPTPRVIGTLADEGPNYIRGAFGELVVNARGVPVYAFKSDDASVSTALLDFLVEDGAARPLALAVPGAVPQVEASVCEATCRYASDGQCDDGGPGAIFQDCEIGTDCADCGARRLMVTAEGELNELRGIVDDDGTVSLAYAFGDQLLVGRRSGDTWAVAPRPVPLPDDPNGPNYVLGVARGLDPADGAGVTWVATVLGVRWDAFDTGRVVVSGLRDDGGGVGPYVVAFRNAEGVEDPGYFIVDDFGPAGDLVADAAGGPVLTLREPLRLGCVGDAATCEDFASSIQTYALGAEGMERLGETRLTPERLNHWNPRVLGVETPDGRRLHVVSSLGRLMVVDTEAGTVLLTRDLPRYGMALQSVAYDAAGRLMVAIGQEGRLMYGPADGDWETVSQVFNAKMDAAELVQEPDGTTRLSWTETRPRSNEEAADGLGALEMVVKMREMRPGQPAYTAAIYSRIAPDRRRHGLVTRRSASGETLVHVDDPSSRSVTEVRVRPSRPLAATHVRVDPTPRLALPDDADADGHADADDLCPGVFSPDADQSLCAACPLIVSDRDADGLADAEDNCPDVYNPSQSDRNRDGQGDACSGGGAEPFVDRDDDGVADAVDNCPDIYNPVQSDRDRDGIGDACAQVGVECRALPPVELAVPPNPSARLALVDDGLGIRPQCVPDAPAATVFRFTARVAGDYTFTTAGSNFDTVLDLRTDCAADRGVSLVCQDDTPGFGLLSLATTFLGEGQTVFVVVAGFEQPSGSEEIVLTVTTL